MAVDPRRLKPSELCRLVNSTPLGEVINERQLYRHRTRAGFRIGDGKQVDLLRYIAWLVHERNAPKPPPDTDPYRKDRASGVAGGTVRDGHAARQRQDIDCGMRVPGLQMVRRPGEVKRLWKICFAEISKVRRRLSLSVRIDNGRQFADVAPRQ